MTAEGATRPTLRITAKARLVAETIRAGDNWGLKIIKVTGMSMSAVYAMLRRMREAGWVTWEQEPVEVAAADRRSPRMLYTMTGRAADELGWHDF